MITTWKCDRNIKDQINHELFWRMVLGFSLVFNIFRKNKDSLHILFWKFDGKRKMISKIYSARISYLFHLNLKKLSYFYSDANSLWKTIIPVYCCNYNLIFFPLIYFHGSTCKYEYFLKYGTNLIIYLIFIFFLDFYKALTQFHYHSLMIHGL